MPTQTPQRHKTTGYRSEGNIRSYNYSNYYQARQSTARAFDYPMTYPDRTTPVRRHPQSKPQPAKTQPVSKTKPALKANMLRISLQIILVVALCMTVLYRYASILESSAQIDALTAEISAIEARNQALQAKIDRGLELGALEEYATSKLGMIRPDGSQMFYIDMQLGDATLQSQEDLHADANNALKGTPGALVHAFRVLK